jgi:hypothetical protein
VDASTATSAAAFGGMSGLVAAAKKEGVLNVITLPDNWANYGTIMKDFTAKYGIKINDANPDGSSQDELNAVQQLKGQSRAPDVLDVGTAFAVKGDTGGLLAPYKVASWANIPASSKAPDATYYAVRRHHRPGGCAQRSGRGHAPGNLGPGDHLRHRSSHRPGAASVGSVGLLPKSPAMSTLMR